jgi:hypothetical protein
MGWCKHGKINLMVRLAPHRFQGIAGGRISYARLPCIVRWVGVIMDILVKWLNRLHNGFKALRAGPIFQRIIRIERRMGENSMTAKRFRPAEDVPCDPEFGKLMTVKRQISLNCKVG